MRSKRFLRLTEKESRISAKNFRRAMTQAEVIMWVHLRRHPSGFRFRRQHPVGPFVADFACIPARLILEIDGATHGTDDELAYDRERDAYLRKRDWRVMRVRNEDVYFDISGVLDSIEQLLPPRRKH
jgi:very-short-patch-repair endonuclease